MEEKHKLFTRREFLNTTAQVTAATMAFPFIGTAKSSRQRVAVVGTGIRGSAMWGKDLLADVGDRVEIVGLCDINRKRVEVCKNYIARDIPTFTSLDAMLEQTRPEKLIVCTKDSTHFHWYLDIYHGADYFRRWHMKAIISRSTARSGVWKCAITSASRGKSRSRARFG